MTENLPCSTKPRPRWPILVVAVVAIAALSACAGSAATKYSALPTQDNVDLGRYAGTWYEQARLPNRFQESCAGDVQAEYSLLPDSTLRVINQCRTAEGKTKLAEGIGRLADDGTDANPARLEVRFAPGWLSWLPPVWGDYWIIRLDADERYSLVGTPDRKYLWVLSRDKDADATKIDVLLDYARTLGFSVDEVVRTPQG